MADLLDRTVEKAGLDRDMLAAIVDSVSSSMSAIGNTAMSRAEAEAFADQPRLEGEVLRDRMIEGRLTARTFLHEQSLYRFYESLLRRLPGPLFGRCLSASH